MDGFAAPVGELRAAGAAAGGVADGVREVDLAAPVRALAAALPGSATARAGAEVGTAWTATISRWATQMQAQGAALTASAASYVDVDAVAAAGFPQVW